MKTLHDILEEFYRYGRLQPTLEEIIKKFAGEEISWGQYRDVYELKDNPNYVLKVERNFNDGNFANVSEYRHWVNLKKTRLGKYLAPCHTICMDGSFLVQTRVKQSEVLSHYPKSIPSLFTDNKIQNYGWIHGRFVCCDYSYLKMGVKYEMKKVKWWCEKEKKLRMKKKKKNLVV